MIKVKICGITNLADAKAAVEFGADFLGFVFYPKSPRYIKPKDAESIIAKISASVDMVGVFVDSPLEDIRRLLSEVPLNWAQLHGDETPDFCESVSSLNVKTVKAIRVEKKTDIQKADKFLTDAILLDAYHPEKYGGTGKTFDWSFIESLHRDIFLAGGITPENVRQAVETGIFAVDISSGVESQPGKKDHKKMKKLFENIFKL